MSVDVEIRQNNRGRSHWSTRSRQLACLLAALALTTVMGATGAEAATADETRSDQEILKERKTVRARQSKDQIVATVKKGDHLVEFVDHVDLGIVGIYETTPLGVTPLVTTMETATPNGTRTPSALELFRALSDDRAPEALTLDHKLRDIGAPGPVSFTDRFDEGPADGSCVYNEAFGYNSQWAWNWHTNVGLFHDRHNQLSFLDDINGNVGKTFYASTSSARKLAGCNGSVVAGFMPIYLTPISYVNGSAHYHLEKHIEPHTQVVYFSAGGPERWDLRMRESIAFNPNIVRNWAIGGAVDDPFGFTSE